MIRWTRTGQAPYQGRYTIRAQENPSLEWATGMLSATDAGVHRFMESAKIQTEQSVKSRSRVDTGLMRAMADSVLHVRGDSYELNFGWWEGAPHYAPYQEFGTVTGIEPMLAVQQTFLETMSGLQQAMARPL